MLGKKKKKKSMKYGGIKSEVWKLYTFFLFIVFYFLLSQF